MFNYKWKKIYSNPVAYYGKVLSNSTAFNFITPNSVNFHYT